MTGVSHGAPADVSAFDRHCMTIALRLGARGLGRTAPNPSVGCVIARDGVILGRGWTQDGGRPHAETEALARAGAAARGAAAYVTLEPCAHHGKTPPCADALIAAGISRVVSALSDPDTRVAGQGLERLRAAGIRVDEGLCSHEAERINRGFLLTRRAGRPLVTLKLATSLDGAIAAKTGVSQWITGPLARAEAHAIRARHDAILVGSGTALADDPSLTCRLAGLERASPVRVVADARLRLPPRSMLARTAREVPVWVLTRPGHPASLREPLEDLGVEIIEIAPDPLSGLDLRAGLDALAARGLTRVMVEGGAQLAGALMTADLVDDLVWFRAPLVMGGDGLPALASLGVDNPDEAPRFSLMKRQALGADLMECYSRARDTLL